MTPKPWRRWSTIDQGSKAIPGKFSQENKILTDSRPERSAIRVQGVAQRVAWALAAKATRTEGAFSMVELLILNAPQKVARPSAGKYRPDRKKQQIPGDVTQIGIIQIHAAKCAAEMRQRKELRADSDCAWKLLQRRKGAGQKQNRQQSENRNLDRLRLGA